MKINLNLRKVSLHGKLAALGVASEHNGLITSNIVDSKLIELMLELILGTDSELEVIDVVLGNLEDTVSPVVGAYGMFNVSILFRWSGGMI
jgi:hypothetical protein